MTALRSSQPAWEVVVLHLEGTGHTIQLARVWLDVLRDASVDRDRVREQLASALDARPSVGAAAAHIAREAHLRTKPPAEQADWLVAQVHRLVQLPQ